MLYDIKAIKDVYRGIKFDSVSEALWSYGIDQSMTVDPVIDWNGWEYHPYFPNVLHEPDFICLSENFNLVIEYKPTTKQVDYNVKSKADEFIRKYNNQFDVYVIAVFDPFEKHEHWWRPPEIIILKPNECQPAYAVELASYFCHNVAFHVKLAFEGKFRFMDFYSKYCDDDDNVSNFRACMNSTYELTSRLTPPQGTGEQNG